MDIDRAGRTHGSWPRPDAPAPAKRDQFSRATWAMIVVAGILLGIAMAMITAG